MEQIGIGAVLLITTSVVHGLAMRFALVLALKAHHERWSLSSTWTNIILTAGLVLVMFGAALLESGLWAAMYVWFGALESFAESFYFSLVTYTSLGYGDITLSAEWALLSAVEAANGIIMFGWTTALIFWFIGQVHASGQ